MEREQSEWQNGKEVVDGAQGKRQIAPGKVTQTSKLPERGRAVQRQIARESPSRTPVLHDGQSANEDPCMPHIDWGAAVSLDAAIQAHGQRSVEDPAMVQRAAAVGVSDSGSALPHLDRIQASFGSIHDLHGVQAHVGGAAQAASEQISADAYASGEHVAFHGPPDLYTAAHEAAHVVQQRAGVSLPGGVGQAGDTYEQHADAVANRVIRKAASTSCRLRRSKRLCRRQRKQSGRPRPWPTRDRAQGERPRAPLLSRVFSWRTTRVASAWRTT